MKKRGKFSVLLIVLALFAFQFVGMGAAVVPEAKVEEPIQINSTFSSKSKATKVKLSKRLSEVQDDRVGEEKVLKAIKTLKDFAGHEYVLTEYSPNGFIIYEPNTNSTLEYSPDSMSPYDNYMESLYYGGPTYYYSATENPDKTITYTHTVTNESFAGISQALHDYSENKYISLIASANAPKQMVASANDTIIHSVSNTGFFENLTNCGYVDDTTGDGYCGYIGATMVLDYLDTYHLSALERERLPIDYRYQNRFVSRPGYHKSYYNCSTALTEKLIATGRQLGLYGGTWAFDISRVVLKFQRDTGNLYDSFQGFSITLPNYNNIANCLDLDMPFEAFSSMPDPDGGDPFNHAVVIYQCQPDDNITGHLYRAHYGWNADDNRYNSVYFYELAFGSGFYTTLNYEKI